MNKLITTILMILAFLGSSAAAADRPAEEVSFARIIVEEYVHLLERRVSLQSSSKNKDMFDEHDKQLIKDIRDSILPRLENGDFAVELQKAGLIAIVANGRRIALRAPNDAWDNEFMAYVKWRARDNAYGAELIRQAENRTGRPFPTLQFKSRSDFPSDEEYGKYVKNCIRVGMKVRAIANTGKVKVGYYGTYYGTNDGKPPCFVIWDHDLGTDVIWVDGAPKDRKSSAYWVEWYQVQLIE